MCIIDGVSLSSSVCIAYRGLRLWVLSRSVIPSSALWTRVERLPSDYCFSSKRTKPLVYEPLRVARGSCIDRESPDSLRSNRSWLWMVIVVGLIERGSEWVEIYAIGSRRPTSGDTLSSSDERLKTTGRETEQNQRWMPRPRQEGSRCAPSKAGDPARRNPPSSRLPPSTLYAYTPLSLYLLSRQSPSLCPSVRCVENTRVRPSRRRLSGWWRPLLVEPLYFSRCVCASLSPLSLASGLGAAIVAALFVSFWLILVFSWDLFFGLERTEREIFRDKSKRISFEPLKHPIFFHIFWKKFAETSERPNKPPNNNKQHHPIRGELIGGGSRLRDTKQSSSHNRYWEAHQ